MISQQYVYLVSLIPFCIVWLVLFLIRKDLRREMLIMSSLIGILSPVTSYYWWTVDWWRPLTLLGTRVGFEDVIMGFAAGGIMAVVYEVVFKKGLYKRKMRHDSSGGLVVLFLLAQTTMWLFWGVGLTSFWASTLSMLLVAAVMLSKRRDLIIDAFLSGILMAGISLLSYYTIMIVSSDWISRTYLSGLSGIKVTGIPIEELVFWFLAGLVFGPFYEYWQGGEVKEGFVRISHELTFRFKSNRLILASLLF
jgi:zinc transporter ZupT